MKENKSIHWYIGEADACLRLIESGIREGVKSECQEAQLIGYVEKLKELMDAIHAKVIEDKISAF